LVIVAVSSIRGATRSVVNAGLALLYCINYSIGLRIRLLQRPQMLAKLSIQKIAANTNRQPYPNSKAHVAEQHAPQHSTHASSDAEPNTILFYNGTFGIVIAQFGSFWIETSQFGELFI
jgi:hypothetical protein